MLGVRVAWTKALPAAAAFAVVTAIGGDSGGFFARTFRLALLAVAALALAAFLLRGTRSPGRREWAMVAALALLTAWTAASGAWADGAPKTLDEAERTALYLVAVFAVLLATDRATLPFLVGGVVAAVTAVSGYGLIRYAISHPLVPVEGHLLFRPIGYANALGIFAAMGILAALGLLGHVRGLRPRLVAGVPVAVLVPTLYLTSSRGAWAALAVGLVTIAWFMRWIRSPVWFVALLVATVAGGILLGSTGGQSLSLVGQNRPHYWQVGWSDFEDHPVLGSGAGTYGAYWLAHRPVAEFVQDAHSLYIETLAELGPIGLALLLGALALPFAALRRRREPLVAGALGAYVAFLMHAAVDWDWEMPAVTLVALCAGTVLLVDARASPQAPKELAGRRDES
jgi:O-antigen ligase